MTQAAGHLEPPGVILTMVPILLLHLLLQKDTAYCATLYIHYGQNEKPEISLPNYSKAEKESHFAI